MIFKKTGTRVIAIVLLLLTAFSSFPLMASAAVASDLPTNMRDSAILRALAYTGYNVQKQKNDGTLYQPGNFGSSIPSGILSDITYGTSLTGLETVADSSTVTGKAPNIAKFEQSGLCCASFVAYYICNYLPNIEGANTGFITTALNNVGTNFQSCSTWQTALNNLHSNGKVERIGTSSSNVNRSKLTPGDIIIFGNSVSSHEHIGIYSGTYNGADFFIHVGNDRGPEIQRVDYMAQAGDKSSSPTGYYHLPETIYEQMGSIQVYKKDPNGKNLSGATFVATNNQTNEKFTIGPTNSNGYAKCEEKVPYGTYTVKETVFPTNYHAYGQSQWTVTVSTSNNGVVTVNAVNELDNGSAKIVKTSEDGKVSGVSFTITGNGVNKTVTTGSNGQIQIDNLKPGTYTVTEAVANKYEPQESRSVTVVSNKVATVTFNNVLKRGDLSVKKTAEDGFIEDITFHLYGTSLSGNAVDEYATTNASGVATFKDVLVSNGASYIIEEVDTEAKYIVPAKQTATIEWDKVTNKTFHNALKKGDLKVVKTSEDNFVEGVKFHLYGTSLSGTYLSRYATTDSSGVALFEDVLISNGASYTIEEVDTEAKYIVPAKQTATIEWNKVTTKQFRNTLKRGDLKVIKTSEDNFVEGVRFRLYGTSLSGTSVNLYATTDKNGVATFEDVLISDGSSYTVEEVDTAEKYVIPAKQKAVIEWNQVTTKRFQNVLKRGELKIIKTSEDNFVEGVRFHLYGTSLSGEKIDLYAVTDAKGVAVFENVLISNHNSYTVEEVDTAEKYVVPLNQRTAIDWEEVTTNKFHNALKRGDLQVKKTSEDGFVEDMEFHLYGTSFSGIKVDEYATTDANGIAKFDDVLMGTGYTLEEVNTPTRYVIPKKQTADIAWNEVTHKEFSNILKKWRADLMKYDSELDGETGQSQGDASLAGAVYGVYKGNQLIKTYVTDKNGHFVTDYYVCDVDWSIREITPAPGYLIDPTVHFLGANAGNFTIEHNTLFPTVYEQVIKGKINLIKHTDDGSTKIETPEQGAKFEIYLKSAGSYAKAKVTERAVIVCDENGFGETPLLPYGVYTVHQVSGWEGRELMPDFDVTIASNGATYRYLINNANFEAYVRVVKKDTETGKTIPYAGAAFKIYNAKGEPITMQFTYPTPVTIDTFYTDANGSLVTPEKLPYGKGYYLVEVTAPYGYVLDPTPVYFDVTADNANQEGGVTVVKVDKTNTPQKGTVTVTKTGEVFYGVGILGGDEVIYQPLFKEQPLAGAIFEIYAAENIVTLDGTRRYTKGELVDTITTGKDGTATSKELYLGKYQVKEIKAPHGMILNTEIHTVELVYAGQEVAVTTTATSVYNERQKATVSFQKALETNELFGIGNNDEFEKVVFGLYADEELVSAGGATIPKDGLLEKISIDKSGLGTIQTDLPFGRYYLKEIATDKHYILNSNKYEFSFAYAGQDTVSVSLTPNNGEEIPNNLIYGSVSGMKITEDGDALQGAVIGLFKKDETQFTKDTALMTTISEKNGSFSFTQIPYGQWVVREIEPPTGFILNTTLFDVVISQHQQVIEIEMVNEFIVGDITLTKVDGEYPENKLTGATFELYKDNNANGKLDEGDTLLGTLSESEVGIYSKNKLRYGHYLVKETVAPAGFLLDTNVYAVFIDTHQKVYEIQNKAGIGFVNQPIKGNISLTKVDAEYPENKLTGATFEVYKDNNADGKLDDGDTLIDTLTETSSGVYEMLDLRYGHYLVKETIAPVGFLLDTNVYAVFIETHQKTYKVENNAGVGFINKSIKGDIVLTKLDAEHPDNTLAGAIFEVYKDTNNDGILDDTDILMGTLTEKENGVHQMKNLRYGHYLVKEKVPPAGFLPDTGVYAVFIDTNGKVYTIENKVGFGFVNTPIKGNITLTKVDAEYPDSKLTGATFEVYKDNNADGKLDEGDTLVGTLTESELGIYTMDNLRYGHYLVRETVAPDGFHLDTSVYSIFIETDGTTYAVENKAGVGFINQPMTGCLKIVKTSSNGKVEGFSFRITGPNGYDVILKTDKNGEIIIEGLRVGEYTVSEVADDVSAAYSLPEDKKAVVMNGSTTIVEMYNVYNDHPKTGEENKIAVWFMIAGASLLGLTATMYCMPRRKEENE